MAEAKQENSVLSDELAATKLSLEDERRESARLSDELARCEPTTGGPKEELVKSKEELKAQKEKYKVMWRMTCQQSREQETFIAAQKEEIERLKAGGMRSLSSHSPAPSETSLLDPPSTNPVDDVSLPRRVCARRGKAPLIDPYSGEDPEVRLDDWLPILKRVADWNAWSEEDTLIQLAGHLSLTGVEPVGKRGSLHL